MSLKDHLRSLGDKEFLQELANSESDRQEQKPASEQKLEEELLKKEKPELDEQKQAKPAAEVKPNADSSFDLDEPEPEEAEASPAKPAPPIRAPERRPEVSSGTSPGVEEIQKVVVTIEVDSRRGKGFLVDAEGRILTNLHLVEGVSRLRVSLPSGDIFLGRLLKTDKARDLALLQIPARTPKYARLGDADSLDVGEDVFVLGKASSALGKMVRAVICGLRTLEGTALIQVNQSVAEADSGSPFVAADGTVIGLSNCRVGDDVADSGFAISVKDIRVFMSGR